MHLLRSLSIISLLSLLFGACGGEKKKEASPPTPPPVGKVTEGVTVFQDDTLEDLLAFDLDLGSGEGQLRFRAGDPALAGLEPGGIIVAGPSEEAPYGFLQRVETIGSEGDEIILATRQATFEDVFEEVDVELQFEIRPDDVEEVQTSQEGITFHALTAADSIQQGMLADFDFYLEFDQVLYDLDDDRSTTHDQIRIDGDLAFSLGFDLGLGLGPKKIVGPLFVPVVDTFRILVHFSKSSDITLTTGEFFGEFEGELEVAVLSLGTKVVYVLGVPITFKLDLSVTLGAEGEFESHIVATYVQDIDMNIGARYDRGDDGWEGLSSYQNDFDHDITELTARGTGAAYIRPEFSLSFFGLPGPYVYSKVYSETDADFDRDPFWELVAGADIGVGVRGDFPVIGEDLDFFIEFPLFRKEMAFSINKAPRLELVSPKDGARLEEGERLDVRVRTYDREDPKVKVSILESGEELASGEARRDQFFNLQTEPLCVGSYEFEIVATDSKGRQDRETIQVVVDNRIPTVTVREDLLEELDLFPGSYLTAFAKVQDVNCDGSPPNESLIEWYLDEEWVGAGAMLTYRIPTEMTPGTELTLEARYDDGMDEGRSSQSTLTVFERPPGTDLPPTVFILDPVDGRGYVLWVDYPLDGVAVDPEDGPLPASSLKWEFENLSRNGWIELPSGATTFNLEDTFEGLEPNRTVRLRLTATDSGGNSRSATVSIYGTVLN